MMQKVLQNIFKIYLKKMSLLKEGYSLLIIKRKGRAFIFYKGELIEDVPAEMANRAVISLIIKMGL